METVSRHLVLHGAIVLLFGLLLGAPYARAITHNAAAHIIHSWRVAHLSLPIGATLMFAVAGVLSDLAVPVAVHWVIAAGLIVSAYGFCLSLPLAALTGQRGLSPGGAGVGTLVYVGNLIGAWSSIVAACALVYAAFVTLWAGP